MNWSKIKNIMITFLIFMNLFMIIFIAVTTFRESVIPSKVIKASINVLEKDGFLLNEELFPSKRYSLPVLDTKFYTASELSELLFKKQLAFRTIEDSLVAKEGRATLTVSGNHFIYESGYEKDDSFSPSKIKSTLTKAGINMDGSVYDENEDCFYYMHKKVNLFNMYLRAKLDDDGEICYLSAQWPSEFKEIEDKNLSFTDSVTKIKNAFPQGGTIKNIELGYSLSNSTNKYVFTPAWRINIDDNLAIIE